MEYPVTSSPPVMPALDEDLQALLAPVPGPDPCGVSIRADALFTDIRLAREEDDPSLPMRQWERPLKKADWPRIEAVCTEALCSRSKDLQLAAWLTEAWTRQDAGIAGLARGLTLLRELVVQNWDGVYPRSDPPQEGGDSEARVAVFEWLDGAMAQRDLHAAARLFHGFKGSSGFLQPGGELHLLCGELEKAADAGEWPFIDAEMGRLRELLAGY